MHLLLILRCFDFRAPRLKVKRALVPDGCVMRLAANVRSKTPENNGALY
jgi:hypothetical protein